MLSRTVLRGLIIGGLTLTSGVGAMTPEPAQAQIVIEHVKRRPVRRVETYRYTRHDHRDRYRGHRRGYYRRGPRSYYHYSEPRRVHRRRVHVIERPRPRRSRDNVLIIR